MDENNLPQTRRVIGIEQRRDQATEILAECYARDLLPLEEYERRVGLIHDASTLDEIEPLLSDVPVEVAAAVKDATRTGSFSETRLVVEQGVQRFSDRRLAAGRIRLEARGGVARLYFNSVSDLPDDIVLQADILGSVVRIYVPPECEVSEELEARSSTVKYKRGRRFGRVHPTHRLRIAGTVDRSVVKIKVKRQKY